MILLSIIPHFLHFQILDFMTESVISSHHDTSEFKRLVYFILFYCDYNIVLFDRISGLVLVKGFHSCQFLSHMHLFLRNLAHLMSNNSASHTINLEHFYALNVLKTYLSIKWLVFWTS